MKIAISLIAVSLLLTPAVLGQAPDVVRAQRTTMEAMQLISAAWDSYGFDHNAYAPSVNQGIVSKGRDGGGPVRWGDFVQVSSSFVQSFLQPTYVVRMPQQDGWGRPFEFALRYKDGEADQYVIRSLGADGRADGDGIYIVGPTTNPESDLVLFEGEFITYAAATATRTLAELNEMKPLDHVVALLEGSGYRYSKFAENWWQLQFTSKTLGESVVDAYVYSTGELLVVLVVIGDTDTNVKLTLDVAKVLLQHNQDVDAAKVCLDDDGEIVYRTEAPLRTVDEEQFLYMLTQVLHGAEALIPKIVPRVTGPVS